MTQDEIIRMAREVGCDNYGDCYEFVPETLERFAALVAAHEREKQAENEPIRFIWNGEGWIEADDYIWKTTDDHERRILYAAPVRTKDLTDEEIDRALDAANVPELPAGYESIELEIARAVIAADREKNK